MDAPKYVIFEACDLYILENEQLDDAKMLRLMRDESRGTGESPEITDSRHVRYRLTSCQNIIEYMKQSV